MKFLIRWDVGSGSGSIEVDAETQEEADCLAYKFWVDAVIVSQNWSAHPIEE
ncbi:MAG: hypothetical protein GY810_01125 [Aureispira sp.]|nr:hypothetical protein [Aureispira sp.]